MHISSADKKEKPWFLKALKTRRNPFFDKNVRKAGFIHMAEMEGFEPPDGLTRQLISSQPRYDHFDTSPCCIFKALRVSG